MTPILFSGNVTSLQLAKQIMKEPRTTRVGILEVEGGSHRISLYTTKTNCTFLEKVQRWWASFVSLLFTKYKFPQLDLKYIRPLDDPEMAEKLNAIFNDAKQTKGIPNHQKACLEKAP